MINKKFFAKNFIAVAIISFFLFYLLSFVSAADLTSTSFIIKDPIVGTAGGYGSSASFQSLFTGHTSFSSPGGTSTSFMTRYGFLYFKAPVDATITFDIDVATTDTDTSAPYSVALGTLTTSSVARSGASINSIWMDLDTGATGGAVITVVSANGALASTSVPASTIPSSTATMSAGTANYGLCVASNTATTGTFNDVAPFNGATCADGAVNNVGAVTTSPQSILNSAGGVIIGGRAQIRVNAAISGVTPAHNDYADALTFIATGTF